MPYVRLPLGQLLDFSGRSVVVTGGAKGIGFGIARRFAEVGAQVIVADLDEAAGARAAADLVSEFGGQCVFVKTDVSVEADVQRLVRESVERFGGLDVMINNAGIFPAGTILEEDVAFWDRVQAVNLRGVFLGCREAGRLMREKRSGSIVNIASIDALHPSMVGLAAYDASKHGVWGFTKNFALEMSAHGVRVNAIAPGGVLTEGVQAMTGGAPVDEVFRGTTERIPMKRLADPDEMAKVAIFLASDMASYLTGSMVVADGGMLLT